MCTDDHIKLAGKSNFTLDDAQTAVDSLLENDSIITTLDVKRALRKNGFTAFQVDVSLAIDQIAVLRGWQWSFNGVYRTFYANVSDPVEDDDDVGADADAVLFIKTFTPKDAKPAFVAVPSAGDWQVFDYNGDTPVKYVKGTTTRNAARNLYCNTFGIDYIDVAANVFNGS